MDKLIIASMDKNAGKSSLIIGMAKAFGLNFGYMKPFGERLVYRKKRLWDYDSALMTNIFGLKENPEDMTIGFDHSKLRYMYDEEGRKQKLFELATETGKGRDVLLIEGGQDLRHGVSVCLDPLCVARDLGGRLLIVISGSNDAIVDDIAFLKQFVDLSGVDFAGVLINKVGNLDEFRETHLPHVTATEIPVLGILPFEKELTCLSVSYLAERLFAKVITGEGGLNRMVRNIFVGAMSGNAQILQTLFKKEEKLIITSGDRTDVILTAIESDTSCIVITNNVLPAANIISKAHDKNIPLLLVPQDTYQTATLIDSIDPLLTRDDVGKISVLQALVKAHVDPKKIFTKA